jgi:hypothetical protein
MRRIRKTQTTVETHEVITVQSSRAGLEMPCPECGRVVRMLLPEEAAAVSGVSLRTVFRQIERGDLHFAESPGGQVYVCANSISQT